VAARNLALLAAFALSLVHLWRLPSAPREVTPAGRPAHRRGRRR